MLWWKRLKKSTPEQEEQFKDMLAAEKVSWKDRITMALAAYITILLPCTLILVAIVLLALWLVGGL